MFICSYLVNTGKGLQYVKHVAFIIAGHDSIINTARTRHAGQQFADVFVNDNFSISINISWNFIPMGPHDNKYALVHETA